MNNIKTNRLFFVLMALIFMAYVIISFMHPEDLIRWLSLHYQLTEEKSQALSLYVNEFTWVKMKITLVIVFVFLGYLFCFDNTIINDSLHAVAEVFQKVKNDAVELPKKGQLILLGSLILFSLALITYSYCTPVQLDELHSWLYFVDKGMLVTASYYPSSNNHIAYNLLSIFWNIFLPALWAIRIVSLLSAVAAAGLFFLILRQRHPIVLAFTGMLLLMSAACFTWYGVQGRGYVLELLSLLFILYLVIQSTYSFGSDRLMILGNAFTLYIVPVAAIPLTLLNLVYSYRLIKANKTHVPRVIRMAIYSIAVVFLCYAPVIIFSGFEKMIANPFVQRITYSETWMTGWISYMPLIWDFISGCKGVVSLVVLITLGVGGALLSFVTKEKFIFLLIGVLALPFILLQVYPVLLFERTWLWLIIPFIWCIVEAAHLFTAVKAVWRIVVVGCFIVTIMWSNLFRSFQTNKLLVASGARFGEMEEVIEKEARGKVLLVYDDAVYDHLLFDQQETRNYTLLHGAGQEEGKADLVLCSVQDVNSSEGIILWEDQGQVLYIPK